MLNGVTLKQSLTEVVKIYNEFSDKRSLVLLYHRRDYLISNLI